VSDGRQEASASSASSDHVLQRVTVEQMTEEGALEHLDALASKYVGRPIRYFGNCIPAHFAETEVPLLCRIRPAHVVALDATGPECRP